MKFDFYKFKKQVNDIAVKYHTLIDIKVYYEYNFAQVAYMTDKFGGTYTMFHVDLDNGEIILNYGCEDVIKIDNMNLFEATVYFKCEEMKQHRDLNYIDDLVNSEYD